MTDREKLIGILDGFVYDDWHGNGDIASYLISHGVVVRDKGEWITHNPNNPFEIYGECSNCGFEQTLSNKFNFCPNCGADMRKRGK